MKVISIDDEGRIKETLIEITPEIIQDWIEHNRLERAYLETKSIHRRWAIIRRVYELLTPTIIERAEKEKYLGMTDPYILDWCKHFSPIEYDAWCSIRPKGLGLFPQYPVLNYFLDFGNPYLKIGVELDGREYHLDVDKDRRRDERLYDEGWKIFRIKGSECKVDYREFYEIHDDYSLTDDEKMEEIESYFMNTSDGVFEALRYVYFGQTGYESSRYIDYAYRTLDRHRLVNFLI